MTTTVKQFFDDLEVELRNSTSAKNDFYVSTVDPNVNYIERAPFWVNRRTKIGIVAVDFRDDPPSNKPMLSISLFMRSSPNILLDSCVVPHDKAWWQAQFGKQLSAIKSPFKTYQNGGERPELPFGGDYPNYKKIALDVVAFLSGLQ